MGAVEKNVAPQPPRSFKRAVVRPIMAERFLALEL
jgi:hypothetical protein